MVWTEFILEPKNAGVIAAAAAILAAALTAGFTFIGSVILGWSRDTYRHNHDNYVALLHFGRVLAEVANKLPVIKERVSNTRQALASVEFTVLLNEPLVFDTAKTDELYDIDLKNALGEIAFKLALLDANIASHSTIIDMAGADFRSKITPEQTVSPVAYQSVVKSNTRLIAELDQIVDAIEEVTTLVHKAIAQTDSLAPRYKPIPMRIRSGWRRIKNLRYGRWTALKPRDEKLYQKRLRELEKIRLTNTKPEQTDQHQRIAVRQRLKKFWCRLKRKMLQGKDSP